MKKLLFSIVETPTHPKASDIYQQYGFEEIRLNTIRTTMVTLKKQQPDILVAEFLYGYANNYSGVHISNLDVLLVSLHKYSPNTKVIAIARKHEVKFMERLPKILPISKILVHPVLPDQMSKAIEELSQPF